jgi:hypothetical protein
MKGIVYAVEYSSITGMVFSIIILIAGVAKVIKKKKAVSNPESTRI